MIMMKMEFITPPAMPVMPSYSEPAKNKKTQENTTSTK
jgi:hypothetical protein